MESGCSGSKEDDAYPEYLRLFYSYLYSGQTVVYRLSGTYTGSMLVPHEPVPGFLDKPITVNTEDFFDIALKAAYDFKLYKSMNLQVNAVIQNIFNAYRMTLTREPTVIRAIFMVLHCREVSLRE